MAIFVNEITPLLMRAEFIPNPHFYANLRTDIHTCSQVNTLEKLMLVLDQANLRLKGLLLARILVGIAIFLNILIASRLYSEIKNKRNFSNFEAGAVTTLIGGFLGWTSLLVYHQREVSQTHNAVNIRLAQLQEPSQGIEERRAQERTPRLR